VRELAMAMELPFIPLLAVVIAGGLGYLLDTRLRTSPLFAIVLGLLGFVAGIREILRRLSKEEKRNGGK
jgi:F0F1-type ATP synthase assembly protein I